MVKNIIIFCCLFLAVRTQAQNMTPEQYIATYKDAAIYEMQRSGVPASITLAQGLLETENGNSDLLRRSNNHFGIKCKLNWAGESVTHTDDAPNECFRKYNSARESYADHSNFLKNAPRYARLFELDRDDYKGWAYGLKAAGYATNPRYPQILISNIEKNNLHQYDLAAGSNELMFANNALIDSTQQLQTITMASQPWEGDPEARGTTSKKNINGIKAVFVSAGTSLLVVATRNNINLQKLLIYNDLFTDGLLQNDEWIFLESKKREGAQNVYIVAEQQTLRSISQLTGVQLGALMWYNDLGADAVVKKGTTLKLHKEG